MGVASKARNWVAKRKNDDFLPLGLTVLGGAISIAAIWWGLAAPPSDFLLNILATLALLGPGLVITNVLVARVESARAKQERHNRTAPVLLLLLSHFNEVIKMGNDFLSMITVQVKNEDPNASGYSLMPLADTLQDARDRIGLLKSSVIYLDADTPRAVTSRRLELTHRLNFPDTHSILHLIERIDRDIPIPLAVLAAQGLLSYSKRVGIDFVDRYPNTNPLRPLGDNWRYVLVQPTKVGFAEASAFAYPPYGSDAHDKRYIDIIKYAECLMQSLNIAEVLLKMILFEIPQDILPQQRLGGDLEEPDGHHPDTED